MWNLCSTLALTLLFSLPASDVLSQSNPAESPAATVGRVSISLAELQSLAEPKLVKVRADEFAIMQRVLDERIAELLLQLETQRTGLSMGELLQIEIQGRTRLVTTEEAKAVYDSSPDRFDSAEEAAIASIRDSMLRQRVAQRRIEYVKELRAQNGVRVFLTPPRVKLDPIVGPARGADDAPVTIVEFTDFRCPYCARMSTVLESLLQRYGSKVRLVFKHFPLSIHKDAIRVGEAAACAEEQGRFWKMQDVLFANANTFSPGNLAKHAREAGLDAERFDECMRSGRGAERVGRDRAEGDRYGVTNTPTYFVNGRFLLGAVPLEAFAGILDEELGRVK